ncbi:MAG: hypothetical protein R2729_26525 [Bryobacteraceae bacterium]
MSTPWNVLVSAFACNPEGTGEARAAWTQVNALARRHRVWVLTAENNRADVEAKMLSHPATHLHFAYSSLPLVDIPERGRGVPVLHSAWQWRAYVRARRLHREIGFDVAWHLNGAGDRMASFLWMLPVPLVWGPHVWTEFRDGDRPFGARLQRSVAALRMRHPLVRLTARNSALALGATPGVRAKLGELGARSTGGFLPAALPDDEIRDWAAIPPPPADPFRVLTFDSGGSGELAIRAFAMFRALHPRSEHVLVASANRRPGLRRAALEMGLPGAVQVEEPGARGLSRRVADCHVVLQPSIAGSAGPECLAAMAAGRPIAALERGAADGLLPPGAAIRAGAGEEAFRDLAMALHELARSGDVYRAASQASKEWVSSMHTAERLEIAMAQCCREAIGAGRKTARPPATRVLTGANR